MFPESLVESAKADHGSRASHWGVGFVSLVTLSLLGFLVAPWSMQDKSLAVLHGLCAQRPSHSFWFGTVRLPFDARMTGIYGGVLVCHLYLLARRRLRSGALPPMPIILTLALFVVAMAIDGFNSLAADLGLSVLYQPNNALRYLTGALTGTTLGVFLWFLAANILWRADGPARPPILRGWSELLTVLALAGGFGLVAGSGIGAFYEPVALALIVGAVLTLFVMALVVIQLGRHHETLASGLRDLAGPATAALAVAYLFLLVTGGGRFLLESAAHLTMLR